MTEDHHAQPHRATVPPALLLNRLAVSATMHCLAGCAIGEILGLVLGSIWGWNNTVSIVVSIILAFVFGYSLTLVPLIRGRVS